MAGKLRAEAHPPQQEGASARDHSVVFATLAVMAFGALRRKTKRLPTPVLKTERHRNRLPVRALLANPRMRYVAVMTVWGLV